MVKVIEENQQNYFKLNAKGDAAGKNAVELKTNLKFPTQILYLFSDEDGEPATVRKISCIHMFESAPQNKIAISYTIEKHSGQVLHLVIIYSVKTMNIQSILQCE